MSARYSNTSSRGLAIEALTVTGSTAARVYAAPGGRWRRSQRDSGGLAREADHLGIGRAVDQFRPQRSALVQRLAQLTGQAAALVEVDALADQGCAGAGPAAA